MSPVVNNNILPARGSFQLIFNVAELFWSLYRKTARSAPDDEKRLIKNWHCFGWIAALCWVLLFCLYPAHSPLHPKYPSFITSVPVGAPFITADLLSCIFSDLAVTRDCSRCRPFTPAVCGRNLWTSKSHSCCMLSVKTSILNLDLNILKGLMMLTSFIATILLFGYFVMSQPKDVSFLCLFCTELLLNPLERLCSVTTACKWACVSVP